MNQTKKDKKKKNNTKTELLKFRNGNKNL